MIRGRIRQSKKHITSQAQRIAQRVANINFPSGGNDIFGLMAGVHGGKLRRRINKTLGSVDIGTTVQSLREKYSMNGERYSKYLPHQQGGPSRGIATASQVALLPNISDNTGEDHSHQHGPNGECLEGEVAMGKGSGMNKGNTVYVDDKGWPVTLAGLIGSGMLSQAQLERASINNVKKLVNIQGGVGTKSENEEMYYMFQRMMLEGFVRGVDITKDIKSGGMGMAILTANNGNPANIGLSTSTRVSFKADWWRSANEQERYMLFMHEVGHNLLNRAHVTNYSVMKSGNTKSNAKDLVSSVSSYNRLVDELFKDSAPRLSGTGFNHMKIGTNAKGSQKTTFDASWFPQLSGADTSTGGGSSTPKEPSTPSEPKAPTPIINNITNTPPTIMPSQASMMINPAAGASGGGGMNMPSGGGQGYSSTPVAGYLSPDILGMTKGFVRGGGGEATGGGGYSLEGLAGALLQSGG